MTTTTRRPPYRLAAVMLALLVAVVSVQLVIQLPKAVAAVRTAR
jgi:hypothetical protein